jgi:hypothetical protein
MATAVTTHITACIPRVPHPNNLKSLASCHMQAMAKADQGGRWSWVDLLTIALGLVASAQLGLRWLLTLQAWAARTPSLTPRSLPSSSSSPPPPLSSATAAAGAAPVAEAPPLPLAMGEHHVSHGGRTRMHTSNF